MIIHKIFHQGQKIVPTIFSYPILTIGGFEISSCNNCVMKYLDDKGEEVA